ncbi:MAG TPA: hypothetical protein PLX53_01355, partial [Tenuifilaceae bacterium]|nr:hypothetical protein [Tenuifilaceae bacterium]
QAKFHSLKPLYILLRVGIPPGVKKFSPLKPGTGTSALDSFVENGGLPHPDQFSQVQRKFFYL